MKWIKKNFEMMAWCLALVIPIFINPYEGSHFSICLWKSIGIPWCPGCGLGRSMAFLYRGEWILSFQNHWLGLPTVILLLHRIILLLRAPIYKITKPTIV